MNGRWKQWIDTMLSMKWLALACHLRTLGYLLQLVVILVISRTYLYIRIASTYIRSRSVLQCVSTLQSLSQLNSVKLLWVPRHQGVSGNKEADRLARIGVETDNFLPEPFIALPLYTVYRYKREWVQANFRSLFTNKAGCLWQIWRTFERPDP